MRLGGLACQLCKRRTMCNCAANRAYTKVTFHYYFTLYFISTALRFLLASATGRHLVPWSSRLAMTEGLGGGLVISENCCREHSLSTCTHTRTHTHTHERDCPVAYRLAWFGVVDVSHHSCRKEADAGLGWGVLQRTRTSASYSHARLAKLF